MPRTASKTRRWFRRSTMVICITWRATPVYGEQGNITGAPVILQDVTRLRSLR